MKRDKTIVENLTGTAFVIGRRAVTVEHTTAPVDPELGDESPVEQKTMTLHVEEFFTILGEKHPTLEKAKTVMDFLRYKDEQEENDFEYVIILTD